MDFDIGLQTRDFKLKHVRFIEAEPGTFEGYASTFGNTDAYGDVFQRGCFKQSVSTNPTRPLLWAHSMSEPIGVVTLEEDSKGLRARGKIVLETQRGREAYELLKAGAVTAMSIGFRPRDFQRTETGLKFTEVEVVETSLVPIPANSEAKILRVKSIEEAKMQEVNSKITDLEQKFVAEVDELKNQLTDVRKQVDAVDLKLQGGGPSMDRGSADFATAILRRWQERRGDYERTARTRFEVDNPLFTRTTLRPSTLPSAADSRIGEAATSVVGNVLDLVPTLPISQPVAYVLRELGTSNWQAGLQTEGGAKAESTATFDASLVPVRTLASVISVSKQMLDDYDGARSFIEARLRYALMRLLENEVLNGDGTGQHFHGIIAQAATWTPPSGVDLYGFLMHAASTVENKGFRAQAVILNPVDALRVRLQRDTTNQYLQPPAGVPPIVTSSLIDAGSFLVGDFSQAVLRLRQPVSIDFSESHSDFFSKNLILIRAEMRGCIVVYSSAAFLAGSLPS